MRDFLLAYFKDRPTHVNNKTIDTILEMCVWFHYEARKIPAGLFLTVPNWRTNGNCVSAFESSAVFFSVHEGKHALFL